MGNEGNLSEEGRKALQPETRQRVRDGMKEKREVKHFTAENTAENAYGLIWDEVVKEYLRSGYHAADRSPDIVVRGETYKTLRRPEVTVFYDASGDTLFDVANERLEKEYGRLMDGGTVDTARIPQARTETYLKYGFVIMENEYLYCPECGDALNAGPAYQQLRCARCGQKISYDGIEWKKDKLLGYLEKGGIMREQVKDRIC